MHVGMGSFFQNLGSERDDQEIWRRELARADAAERLGFGSVWAPEHHFDGYTMSPNVLQFLTWVAARTRRVRLGSMVVVLPWHDPVRVAEEVSVLDHMSSGRVVLGIGRGLGRIEFDGFRVRMDSSRKRFNEYAEAILTAFDTGYIEYEGEAYTQPRTAIRPGPLAPLRGRTYASAVSPESVEIMARLGVGIMIIAQKPWETVVGELDAYRNVYREMNGTDAPRPLWAVFVAVHSDRSRAEEMYERHMKAYFHSVVDHYEFHNDHLATIPGYEYYGKLSESLAKHGRDGFVSFLSGLQAWGTPEDVTEQIVETVRMIDGAGVIAVFSYGGMPDDVATANVRLFAERVLPALRAADGHRDIPETATVTLTRA